VSRITLRSFLINEVNRSTYAKPTRLDRTLKGIVGRYSTLLGILSNKENSLESSSYTPNELENLIDYVNRLRVNYYFKRLEYRYSYKAKEFKGKSRNLYFYFYFY